MIISIIVILWLASAVLSAYIMAKKVGVDISAGWALMISVTGPIGLLSSLVVWADDSNFVILKGKK